MGWGLKSFLIFVISIFLLTLTFSTSVLASEPFSNDNIKNCVQNNYNNLDFLEISNLNDFLDKEGFLSGEIKSYMTTSLKLAIKNFQRFVGIRVDGIIGPSTHKAMTSFNSCTKAVEAELIECSGYLAYKECTFFMNEILEVSSQPTPVATTTISPPVCNDETFQPYTLYSSSGDGITVMSCKNESDAIALDYTYKVNPKPVSSSSEVFSTSLVVSNLNATISVDENQKSVVTVNATGTGGLTYSLSGTDAHLMSIDGSGVITLNSNADYEQKTSYSATVGVSDSVGSTSKSLNVSINDVTEYTTINIRSWYDDATLPNCQDNIIENGSVICGIRTPTLLDATRAETELWQNRRFSNSDVDLRINLLPPLEWTSLTSTESGYLTSDTESSVNIFVGNEQINKDRVRNGIQVPHLIETWGQSSSAYLGIINGIPNPQNHMTSKGVIRSFGAFGHELGHSLGLNHAVNQSSEAATFEAGTYNYGYYDSVNNIGTPLSYDGISCFIYSNPDKLCPTQAERDTRELLGLFDSSGTDLDKWLDGTWGSIPAGTSQADSSRFLQENLIYYERIIPNTNYGVTAGTDYVSTMSLLPQFNGASASYSYTENLPGLTTPDSLTMYSTVADNETENSTTYSTLTWCSVQNCDIIYGNIFAWEGKTGYNARVGYQFYFNQGNLYLKRAKPIYEFATNSQGNHINYPTPCLQINKYMKIGDYIETDCTSQREDIMFGAVDKTNWNFTNVVDKELVVTPYGTYDAYKIITSHSKWEFPSGRIINAQFDHNKLIFWVAPDTGIVMFEDEQHRRWKLTAMDSDGDGTDNLIDTDDDNDGVLDVDDALPLDPNSSTDNNNDGRADEDE